MGTLVIIICIIWFIVWAVSSATKSVVGTARELAIQRSIDTTKTLQERNQDVIQDCLEKIRDDSWPHYVENQVRDCIGEIAKREGRPALAPKYREWLSVWQGRSDIPAEYQELKNYLKEIFQTRFDEIKTQKKNKEDVRKREDEEMVARDGEKLFERNKDLIDKFLEITERKVSIIDDYGDENWDVLPDEVSACLKKIAQREALQIDWQAIERAKRKRYISYSSETLPDEYRWLQEKLQESFKEYHKAQKSKPTNGVDLNSLSGVEFETYVANVLKENGYDDVRGTPATGDQGADLIAKKEGKTIIIQAKRYQGTVGNKAVQEVIGAVQFYGGDEGWVITNSTFTPSAKALAQKSAIKLIDGQDLTNIGDILS